MFNKLFKKKINVFHIYRMSEKLCVYCQEVTPHYVNKYACFERCNCEPLSSSESEYESDSSSGDPTYVPGNGD